LIRSTRCRKEERIKKIRGKFRIRKKKIVTK